MLCALCGESEAKEISHIVPAFVFRWLKESSPTGFLRGTENPNKREQDGVKHELLCATCEDNFSKWETIFCNEVFRKVHQGRNTALAFNYETWLSKFCVSVSWRTLSHLRIKNDGHKSPFGHDEHINSALDQWRRYLLGEINDLGIYRQHILITDTPISSQGIENNFDLMIYFKRAVDFNTMHAPEECYIITHHFFKLKPSHKWLGYFHLSLFPNSIAK